MGQAGAKPAEAIPKMRQLVPKATATGHGFGPKGSEYRSGPLEPSIQVLVDLLDGVGGESALETGGSSEPLEGQPVASGNRLPSGSGVDSIFEDEQGIVWRSLRDDGGHCPQVHEEASVPVEHPNRPFGASQSQAQPQRRAFAHATPKVHVQVRLAAHVEPGLASGLAGNDDGAIPAGFEASEQLGNSDHLVSSGRRMAVGFPVSVAVE
jgi:hypothetical protein